MPGLSWAVCPPSTRRPEPFPPTGELSTRCEDTTTPAVASVVRINAPTTGPLPFLTIPCAFSPRLPGRLRRRAGMTACIAKPKTAVRRPITSTAVRPYMRKSAQKPKNGSACPAGFGEGRTLVKDGPACQRHGRGSRLSARWAIRFRQPRSHWERPAASERGQDVGRCPASPGWSTKPLVGCSQNAPAARNRGLSEERPQVKEGSTHRRSKAVSAHEAPYGYGCDQRASASARVGVNRLMHEAPSARSPHAHYPYPARDNRRNVTEAVRSRRCRHG
jgi:hypothetical protein